MGTEKVKDEDFEKSKKKKASKDKKEAENYTMPKQSNFIESKKSFWKQAEEKEREEREKEAAVAPLTSEISV